MMTTHRVRWSLVLYDIGIFVLVEMIFLVLSGYKLTVLETLNQIALTFVLVFSVRLLLNVYGQIWRYGGIQCYIRLLACDGIAGVLNVILQYVLCIRPITFSRLAAVCAINALGSLSIRMLYRYAYKCGGADSRMGEFLRFLLRMFAGKDVRPACDSSEHKIRIAIVGAGNVGVSLAEELLANPNAAYLPVMFLDTDTNKTGRAIHDIPVYSEDAASVAELQRMNVQEIVFAVPKADEETRKELYEKYTAAGYKVKVFDFPLMQAAGGRRHLREFDIEELLFRKRIKVMDEAVQSYYRNKVILITGGGGSIGSELCRQLANTEPKQIIVLDVYENCAYDLQQELKLICPRIDLRVEIVSVCNRTGLRRVFSTYRPEIVIHAAAHKHVPLMEHNCIEAVENNVMGTLNVVRCCEEFHAQRFLMVSTDKAVNPTNVMGATKRLCEMIAQAYSTLGNVTYSATRFGNVLGSAGSVIPLFKRQIAAGGPVTLTDKRIVRYFMTIPEASQLVLASGAMAKNGELFVLDMGQPIQIYNLAKNMIRLSGAANIDIVETGLRPGEKLYEELLINGDNLTKTDNELIFIEQDTPISMENLEQKLSCIRDAIAQDDDDAMRLALRQVVPTFKDAVQVNAAAETAREMQAVKV